MKNHIMLTRLASAVILLLFAIKASGQIGLTKESDLIKQADKLFEGKNYEKAMPLYSQIVSNHPDHAYYNYCLGVCILKIDGDKADAVRFLTTATQSKNSADIPTNAWLHLGTALHRAYRYEEAITTLQIYQKSSSKSVWNEAKGDELIAMCRNAINSNNDLSLPRHSILSESETDRKEFHAVYKNISGAGRFLRMPAEYEHKLTKGKPEGHLVFLNGKGNTIVFTGVGKTTQNSLDIFIVSKDKSGKWQEPQSISTEVNSVSDEAFPVLVDNDRTLYFSSKGYKSTGGYDVFKSELDPVSGKWSDPVSMGTPVNSPGDDFYYILTDDGKNAYFSSDRESPAGKCNVYTASVIKDERNFVAINGLFDCREGLESSDAKVTILNKSDRSLMAQFRTSSMNGDYSLKLPIPSELIYKVKLAGFSELEAIVDLTRVNAPIMLQDIVVARKAGGGEVITVTNRMPEIVQPLAAGNAPAQAQSHEQLISGREGSVLTASVAEPKTGEDEIINASKTGVDEAKVNDSHGIIDQNISSQKEIPVLTSKANVKTEQTGTGTTTDKTAGPEKSASVSQNAVKSPGDAKEKTAANISISRQNSNSGDIEAGTKTGAPAITKPVAGSQKTAGDKTDQTAIIIADPVKTTSGLPELKASIDGESHDANTLKAKASSRKTATDLPALHTIKAEDSAPGLSSSVADSSSPVNSNTIFREIPNDTYKNVVFRVQLGVFRKKTEKDLKKKFDSLGLTDVEYVKSNDSLLFVVTGNAQHYSDALLQKEQLVKQGISDAFIVAFSGDQKLPANMFVVAETIITEEE